MSRKLLPIILIIVLIAVVLSACTTTTFKVTFVVDGQVYTEKDVKKSGTVAMPTTPVKSGYTFDGWYLDKDVWTQPFNSSTAVIADITVYAHWVKIVENLGNTYVVTFDSMGGSAVAGLRVKEGASFTLPEPPTLQDYNFDGWYLDTAYTVQFTEEYKLTRSVTVYAKWSPVDSTTYFVRTGSVITSLTSAGQSAATIVLPESIDGVKITAIGEGLFKDNLSIKSVSFPSGSGYTEIGKEAFSGCTLLAEIKLINGISIIGEGAFSGCTALKNVQLPTSLKAISKNLFKGCSALQYATLYDTVTAIGDGAYYGCTSLTSVRIRSAVESIGKEAFYGCSSLRSVGIDEGVSSIGEKAFYNCVKLTGIVIPDSVTSLGSHVLYGCTSLTEVTIGSGVTSIPDYSLYNAKLLETLTIAENSAITSIGASAFAYCTELENFTLPSGITSIGQNAFNGCKDITSFVVPSGVTKLETQTFLNAVNLVTVTLHDGVTEIGNSVFGGCTELTTVTGTEGLTSIGSGVFKSCVKLDNVLIPAGVSAIKDSTFEDCRALSSIVISDGVTSIEKHAFSGCTSLSDITLPLTLTSIGDYAFAACSALSSVTVPASVTSLSATAFDNCTSLQSIEIASSSVSFESEGGVIYTKGKEHLIFYSDALSLVSFTVPEGVKSIYPEVFKDNLTITEVILPSTLEEISEYAFSGCTSLASVNFPDSLKIIGQNAFDGTAITSANLPIGVHTIDQYAFKNVKTLTSATLPITLVSVGKGVFYGARSALAISVEGDEEGLSGWSGNWSLASEVAGFNITYGKGRITSGDYQYFARDGKAVLTDYRGSSTIITVPELIDGYKVIGLYKTFSGESAVMHLSVPNTVELISEMSFKGMTSLAELTVPFAGAYRNADGVEGLFGYAFDYSENSVAGWFSQYAEGGALASYYVEIPDSIRKVTLTDCEVIAYGAFSRCHDITAIVLPECVKEIKGMAFYHCSLEEVYLPAGLEKIGSQAFTYNYNRYQDTSSGISPQVTFNCAAAVRPEGWVEGCFDENSKFNYGVA